MYTDEEIREKQQLARAAGLSGAELLDDAESSRAGGLTGSFCETD